MRPYSMDLRRRVVAACDRKDGRRKGATIVVAYAPAFSV